METIENTLVDGSTLLPLKKEPQALAPVSHANGYMDIIGGLAQNPTKESVEIMKEMMAMQERWEDRQAETDFNACIARVCTKLAHIKIVKKRGVSYDKTKGDAFKYAAMEDIDLLVAPVLSEENVTVSFDTEPSSIQGWHNIILRVSHGRHTKSTKIPLPLDSSGGKNNAQSMGSTYTYGKRYALCAFFNIVTIGEDDDAQGGAITDAQAAQIKDGLKETGLDVARFLKSMKVPEGEGVESIRTREYVRALAAIENKRYTNKKITNQPEGV